MPSIRLLIYCLLVGLLNGGCASINLDNVEYPGTPHARIAIFADGKASIPELESDGVVKFHLQQKPFTILVPKKQLSTSDLPKQAPIQICATAEKSVFSQLRPGFRISDIPCFKPGTGMATSRRGDNPKDMRMSLSKGNAHNYYSPDRYVDGKLYSAVYVNNTFPRGKRVYLVIVRDNNMNNVVDEDEYEFIELDFAKKNKEEGKDVNKLLSTTPEDAVDFSMLVFHQSILLRYPKEWGVTAPVYKNQKGNSYFITEFIPKGQVLKTWKDMFTIQGFSDAVKNEGMSTEKMMTSHKEKINALAPAAFYFKEMYRGDVNGYSGIIVLMGLKDVPAGMNPTLPKGVGEIGLYLFLKGQVDMYIVHRSWKTERPYTDEKLPMDETELNRWIRLLKQVRLIPNPTIGNANDNKLAANTQKEIEQTLGYYREEPGTPSSPWGNGSSSHRPAMAVKFTPSSYPVTINSVTIYAKNNTGEEQMFNLYGYTDDLGEETQIFKSMQKQTLPETGSSCLAKTVKIPATTISQGSFHIVLEWLRKPLSSVSGKNSFFLCTDSHRDFKNTNYFRFTGKNWKSAESVSSRSGNLGIIVNYSESNPGGEPVKDAALAESVLKYKYIAILEGDVITAKKTNSNVSPDCKKWRVTNSLYINNRTSFGFICEGVGVSFSGTKDAPPSAGKYTLEVNAIATSTGDTNAEVNSIESAEGRCSVDGDISKEATITCDAIQNKTKDHYLFVFKNKGEAEFLFSPGHEPSNPKMNVKYALRAFERIYRARGIEGVRKHVEDCYPTAQATRWLPSVVACMSIDYAGTFADVGYSIIHNKPGNPFFLEETTDKRTKEQFERFAGGDAKKSETLKKTRPMLKDLIAHALAAQLQTKTTDTK